jgi:hypothetical protein
MKMKEVSMIKLNTKKTLLGIALAIVLMPLLYLTSTFAATFSFSPVTGEIEAECNRSVNIEIDATGEASNAADIEISYDPSEITIRDSNGSIPGKQIKPGNAYESYFYNEVNESEGIIRIAAGSFVSELTGKRNFATIEFISNPGVTTTSFDINFTGVGDTLDSNIAESATSDDILTGVTNGSYTFVERPCTRDRQAPNVIFVDPEPLTNGVPLDSDVTIRITDNRGTDIDSIEFEIDGEIYTPNDPEVTFTGDPEDYTFIINPRKDFPEDQEVVVRVKGEDLAGNRFNRSMVLNVPVEELVCEETSGEIPEDELCLGDEVDPDEVSQVVSEFFNNPPEIRVLAGTPLEDTLLDDFLSDAFNTLGPQGISLAFSGFVFTLGIMPFLHLLNAPILLFNLLAILLGRRKKKPWGIIIDASTRKPVAFANCRLYLTGTRTLVNQTVSDLEGRYGFAIRPGSYRLEVKKPGYAKFTTEIKVEEGETGYVFDVRLVPNTMLNFNNASRWQRFKDSLMRFYQKSKPIIFTIGFTVASVAMILSPIFINILVFMIYIAVLFAYLFVKLTRKARYASVIDADTNLRVPYASVKVFDPNTWELVDTQLTNENGQFDYWGPPGEYALLVAVRGYKFPSKRNNLPLIESKYNALVKAFLKQGKNNINLYVDELTGNAIMFGEVGQPNDFKKSENTREHNTEQPQGSNLQSPFN